VDVYLLVIDSWNTLQLGTSLYVAGVVTDTWCLMSNITL